MSINHQQAKKIVREGYDKVSYKYQGDELAVDDEKYVLYQSWLESLHPYLKSGSSVLDLGCGCGLPACDILSKNYQVTGIDISPVQIDRAQNIFPNLEFICGDICSHDFREKSFDAIISLYSLIHVPTEEQEGVLQKVYRLLKNDGVFLFIAGQEKWTGVEEDWLEVKGGTMYWSQMDRGQYLELLNKLNFHLIWDKFIPELDTGHCLFLAQKKT